MSSIYTMGRAERCRWFNVQLSAKLLVEMPAQGRTLAVGG